jgi:hypothetical protein
MPQTPLTKSDPVLAEARSLFVEFNKAAQAGDLPKMQELRLKLEAMKHSDEV